MNLYIKFLMLIIKRILNKKPQEMLEPCISHFRVGLLDLDLNFHMNNGRYFSIMDLGRIDLMIRAENFIKLFKNGYFPVILSESMVFAKSLNYLNKYELHTKVDSWDEKFFYITQKFIRNGEIAASAHVRGCFKKRGKKGIIPVKELLAFVGEENVEPQMHELAQKQIEIDSILLPRDQ